MIKSIMFPTPERFNFYFEQNMYLLGTLSVAIIGVAAALYVFIEYYEPFYIIIRYSLAPVGSTGWIRLRIHYHFRR